MSATPALPPARHLRQRDEDGVQETTSLELFFDLVYVFAATQVSHLILHEMTLAGVLKASFLLMVVWWAWNNTTWMVNWFDPASSAVRAVLLGVMLASLVMAAALPEAFTEHGLLFAVAFVGLQVGRNAAAVLLLSREHPLRIVIQRLVGWSVISGALWIGGALLEGDERLYLWIPALLVELVAPAVGYWLPVLGRSTTVDWTIDGAQFAERCQGFLIIALGESIVVTGATAADAGLSGTVVLCLAIAFLETAALWWLYFGVGAEHSSTMMGASDDPGRLARDAYTYGHLPLVAGIIATAVGDDLLLAEPHDALHGVGLAMVLGGPALFLLAENAFRWRLTRTTNPKRTAVAIVLLLLLPVGGQMSALALSAIVAAALTLLAFWEVLRPGPIPPAAAAVLAARERA